MYFCGENFSNQQAWMEGALFTADKVLKQISLKKIVLETDIRKKIDNVKVGGSKKTKKKGIKTRGVYVEYTMKEVKKHNTRKDAWIVIKGNVYDITEWIDKHPGGDIIMKGVGKDATQLFESIGHPEYVKKILKKMKVGKLI